MARDGIGVLWEEEEEASWRAPVLTMQFGHSEKALVDVTLDLGPSQPFRAFLCGFPSLWYSVLAMGKTKISSLHRLFSFYYLSPPF